ncbi:MAG: TetR/AcrR family transcriptional regulator [Allosphingosinicella sp.]|uniref:TetR/AcrR family transcriptional regulator n=1 Tax=Allosphingosinicella sp. TaxID=2823234 RepID=UPI0039323EB8
MASRTRRHYRGAPPEERRAQRREQLLLAAIQVYGERGYRNATVKAVCEAAGLTERYFYESFANSEALLAAAYQAVVQHLLRELAATGAGAGGPPEAKVRAILAAYYSKLRDDPRSARLFLVEVAGVSPDVDEVLADSLGRFGELLADTLGARPDPMLRTGVVGGVLHIALGWVGGGYREPIDEVVDAALSLCLLLK